MRVEFADITNENHKESIASNGQESNQIASLNTLKNSRSSTNMRSNIKAVVRIRPLNSSQPDQNQPVISSSLDKRTIQIKGHQPAQLVFDGVAPPHASQADVFNMVGLPMLDNCIINGCNSTIILYGQTGSGKTYTALGSLEENTATSLGLAPRVFSQLFDRIEKQQSTTSMSFSCSVSMMEIYNERITDLLLQPNTTTTEQQQLVVRQNGDVDGLSHHTVGSLDQAMKLLMQGTRNRRTAATKLNIDSSRSHCIIKCDITNRQQQPAGQCLVRSSSFTVVDLAGSERLPSVGDINETSVKETASINKSLLNLGLVIAKLATGSDSPVGAQQQKHVPYRDSKLTQLLQSSLGGNSKTVIVATVNPSAECLPESISTLNFAQRATRVINRPSRNERLSTTTPKAIQTTPVVVDEAEELRQKLYEAEFKLSMKDKELDVVRAQVVDALGQVDGARQAADGCSNTSTAVKTELARAKMKIRQLEEAVQEANDDKLRLQANLARVDKSLRCSREEVKLSNARADRLRQDIAAGCPRVAGELADLRVAATAARQEVAVLAEKAAVAQVESLNADASNSNTVAALRAELATVTAQLKKAERAVEERSAAVKAADIRAERMEKDILHLKANLSQAVGLLKERDAVTLDLENQLSDVENKLEKSDSSVKELQKRVDATESAEWRVDDLTAQIDELQDALLIATGAAYAGRAAVDELEAMLVQSQKECTNKDETIKELGEEIKALEAEKAWTGNLQMAEMAALKASVAQKNEKLEALQRMYEELEQQSFEPTVTVVEDTAKIDQLKQQMQQLHVEMAHAAHDSERHIQDLEYSLVEAQEEIKSLKDKVATSHAEALVQATKVQRLKKVLDQEREEYQAAVVSHDASLTALEEDNYKLKQTIKSLKSKMTQQRDAMLEQQQLAVEEAARAHLLDAAVLEERIAGLESELDEAVELQQQLQNAVEEADVRVSEAANGLVVVKEERDLLMQTLTQLQEAYEVHEAKHVQATNAWKEQLDSKTVELEVAQKALKEAEDWLSKHMAAQKKRQGDGGVKKQQRLPLQSVENTMIM